MNPVGITVNESQRKIVFLLYVFYYTFFTIRP